MGVGESGSWSACCCSSWRFNCSSSCILRRRAGDGVRSTQPPPPTKGLEWWLLARSVCVSDSAVWTFSEEPLKLSASLTSVVRWLWLWVLLLGLPPAGDPLPLRLLRASHFDRFSLNFWRIQGIMLGQQLGAGRVRYIFRRFWLDLQHFPTSKQNPCCQMVGVPKKTLALVVEVFLSFQ